jgi:imidazole glycerol-phosphate synthase subunit HisH
VITIIDYGVGNLGSILNMFKKIGVEALLSQSISDINNAQKLLLPGVGSFDYGMKMLNESGYVDALNKRVLEEKVPLLGICLGMQLMTKRSDEGQSKGLGWFDAETVKFNLDTHIYKIPHMGWNEVQSTRENALFKDMFDEPRFYFVHSYHVQTNNSADILLKAHYGYDFVCGLQKNNIYGAQFHPEKSHKYGMKLLKNFAEYC